MTCLHYVLAADNPDGVRLTADNMAMMKRLIPWPLRLVGFGWAPRIATQALLGEEGLKRVGLRPIPGHKVLKGLLHRGLRLVQGSMDDGPAHFSDHLGRVVFQHMIDKSRGGEVTFLIPDSMEAVRRLA